MKEQQMTSTTNNLSTTDHHREFCEILPRIRTHARIHFRGLRDPNQRDDAVAESIALSWHWYCRLHNQGKNPNNFVSALAKYAVNHVRSGRRLCGQEKARDITSKTTQLRNNFWIESYPDKITLHGNQWEIALHDTKRSSIPDQVCFRIDFRTWLQNLSIRDRTLAKAMMMGHATQLLAKRFKVSPARISQIRRELYDSWTQFCNDSKVPQNVQ